MKEYRILYVDGYNNEFKEFKTQAETDDEALGNLRDSYKNGDFEHTIIAVESSEDITISVKTMNALPVRIYEPKGIGNCSNHGISERFKEILLVCDSGHIKVTGEEENLCIVEKRGNFVHVRPYKEPEHLGWMDGGCVVYTSDSRFPSDYPLSLHDRQETRDEYNTYSC